MYEDTDGSGGGLVIMFILLESNLLWNTPDIDDVVTVALV